MAPIQIEGFEVEVRHQDLSIVKKTGLAILATGLLLLLISLTGISTVAPVLFLFLSMGLSIAGALIYIIASGRESLPGIKNDHIMFNSFMSRRAMGWILAALITGFYRSLLVSRLVGKLDTADGSSVIFNRRAAC